ncbi:MAG TPA: Ig-like domain repeat protein, partial [Thermoanaerobaculia bacterium]|nr:Ig-like domain repeat protein [Thermoanaerobaculia bacterium]
SGTFSPGGVTVNNIQSVNAQIDILAGSLQLLAGKLKTSEKVIVGTGGTVSRVAGWVDGTLRRTVDLNVPFTFDVGGATGYSPVVFHPTAGVAAGDVDIRPTEDAHPVPLGGNALRRYWNVFAPGFTNADLTLRYNPTDVVGTESNLRLVQFSAGSWTSLGTITNAIAHEVHHTGATMFGDFGLVSPATALAFGPINGGVSPRATVPFPVVVKAVDADGGSVIVLTSTDVVVSLDPPNAGSGLLSGALTATIPANSSAVTLGSLTYSVTSSNVRLRAERGASGESLTTGFSAPLTFLSLAANHLGVNAPPAATAGTPFSVTVSALDANGITDSGYRGRVHFTTSDAFAAGLADYTFTAADLGSHTFSVTLLSSGAQSLAFTDTATSSIQGSGSVTVTKGSTTATLIAAPNPSTYGQSVTLTATVDPVAPAVATPTGTVTFFDGATSLGTVALSSGTALLTDSSLAAGVRSPSATYNGSNSYNSSTSAPFVHTIDPSPTTTTLTATLNPSVFGQSVVFTIIVAASGVGGGVPSGTVSLLEGATTLGSGSLDGSGQVQIPLANLPVGAHSLMAAYAASANHAASTSSVFVQNVGKSGTVIALGTSNASTIFGDAVTFTATLSALSPGAGLPTGTVEFFDGATSLGTGGVNGIGEAALTTSSLSVGTHSITANYSGDAGFDPVTSSVLSQSVGKATPIASLVSSATPSSFGQSVTFTATLSSLAATPTGTVTFTDGATTLGAVPLSAGIATYTSSSLALGAHPITATYGGDGSFLGASDSLTQTVDPTATSVAVTATPAPSTFGEEIAITATVTPATAITPTGNVVFKEGTTTLHTMALVNGVATFETSDLTAGSHSIVAEYMGDTNNSAGSGSLLVTVNPASTATVIATSGTPSLFGQSVTFTIHVTPALSGIPTGTVTLSEGASTIATVPLIGGVATHSTAALSVGTHTITATYNGDANFNGRADDVEQVVQKATATVAVGSGSPSTTYGQSVTFTATLTASTGNPTGTIRFVDGATDLGTVGVTAGSAAFTTSALTPGSHSITAVYSGDASFETATSPAIGQTVSAAATTTTLGSSAAPSTFGQSVILSATVASPAGTPTGTVVFADGATAFGTVTLAGGIAQWTTSALTVGSHLVSATYSGDSNAQPSFATFTQIVDGAPSTISLASSMNPAPFGTTLSLTATVASTVALTGGTVTFHDGATLLGTVPLTGNSATLSIGSARDPGVYLLRATYSGTGTHAPSPVEEISQTIDPATTSVTLTSSTNPSAVSATVQFTATVTSVTGVVPTGTVTFFDGAANLGSAPLSGGVATLSTAALAAGDHPITAAYSGSAHMLGSTSAELTQEVGVVVTLSSIAPQSICQGAPPFTLTVHGSGFDATTRVRWNGDTRTPTLVDAGTLILEIATADVDTSSDIEVTVLDAGNNPVANPQTFTVAADVTAPVVVAPPPITVAQSVCSPDGPGARASDVPALLAFLQSATATDECSVPIALTPQLDGFDIDEDTVFPGGTSDVSFRFIDRAGNITPAVSQVTVQLFGDLSSDGNVDASDRLILENYLVGNLQQGTAPFIAPLSAADLNGDGNVDSTDSLLLANQLVGNIDCLRTNRAGADSASASIDASLAGRRRAVRPPSATEVAFPVRIDLTGVRIDEQPATLGSYVVRVTFDPDRVRVRSVRGGATPQFAATPAATEASVANHSGVLRISGVQLDRYAPIGLIEVAQVRLIEIAPDGLSSVTLEIESLARSFVPSSSSSILSMPAATPGGRIQ